MIDWSTFLKIPQVLRSKEDVPEAMRLMARSLSDNILRNMIRKSRERGHEDVLRYLLEEKKKRGL